MRVIGCRFQSCLRVIDSFILFGKSAHHYHIHGTSKRTFVNHNVHDLRVANPSSSTSEKTMEFDDVEFDWSYLSNSTNLEEIRTNISNRKGVGDIDGVEEDLLYNELKAKLQQEANKIPNRTHPESPVGDEACARQLMLCGRKKEFPVPPKSAVEVGESLDILRTQFVGHSSGAKTYYLKNALALLEQALVQFTIDTLIKQFKFTLVSVPNLIRPEIIESCGFKTTGERTQVYHVKQAQQDKLCLAGTGEFPLAGFFQNRCLMEEELPKRVATVSHCYRAETSDIARESGLYRVHQFTKVEMFAVCSNENNGQESDSLLNDFVSIERCLFEQLGLHFRVLDMPTQELGAPAYRKIDMEAWLPARQFWGEISSTSNCTDYQSRRLGIKYKNKHGITRHCHTVNGTACAVPRMIIAILENYQQPDGTVIVPEVLEPYMGRVKIFSKPDKSISINGTSVLRQMRKLQQDVSRRSRRN